MNDILQLVPLIKWYILINLVIIGISSIGFLIFLIKKGILKFAFRKHDVWQLHEQYEKQQTEIYELRSEISDLKSIIINSSSKTKRK